MDMPWDVPSQTQWSTASQPKKILPVHEAGTLVKEPTTKPKDDPREKPLADPTVPTFYGMGYRPPNPEHEQTPIDSTFGYKDPEHFEVLSQSGTGADNTDEDSNAYTQKQLE